MEEMNTSNIFKVAVIGAGFIGKKYLRAFYMNTRTHIQVICDNDMVSAIELQNTYKISRYEMHWQNVVQADDVDIVCICVPNNLHYMITDAAIRNHKHVICEKPLGQDVKESILLMELAKNYNVVVSCSYNLIRLPAIVYAKKLIESKELGELVNFYGSYYNGRLADQQALFEWRMMKKYSQGGSLNDLAINILSISQYLLGDIKSVCGMTRIIHPLRNNKDGKLMEVENDDIAHFIFVYNDGATGYISSNRVAPGSMQNMQFEIQFTQGVIRFSLEQMNEIYIYRMGEDGFTRIISDKKGWFNVGYDELKEIDINTFIDTLVFGGSVETNFQFAAKIDCVIASVLESANTQKWIDVKIV